ncbi:MAG: ABC transporter substrate-binding protein [Desulfomonile tiedjei]|uniref:ABC transporter substrate-binding protein n=1 Tax=Desulfomonile tiedjei TaxID=2358 RepID=A0A9D6V1R9_9BACT|nr:ABC transporter substrate-binding protein [Desulfomonile tiedjei]
MNVDRHSRKIVRMGYMPVVTNLAAPLLDYASRSGTGIQFEALKFSSFAEMGESLRNGHIHAAFIIAPLSIVLHQQGAGVKLVYIGNRHESTLVCRKDLKVKSFADLAGKTIAVPMRYSGHNIATRMLGERFGLSGSNLNIVEMNPPDMPSALATGSLDAYFVGEPFAAKTVHAGESQVVYYVEQFWPNFICNLMLVKQDFIDLDPEAVSLLVQAAARSGMWAKNNVKTAAEIVSKYWNQPADLVEYAMNTPLNRVVFDKFVPKYDEMQNLSDLMVKFKLLEGNDIQGLIDDSFAKNANLDGISDIKSILNPPKE